MADLIIRIDDEEFEADFNKGTPNISINGKPFHVEMMTQLSKDYYSFSVNNRICQIEFELNEYGKSHIILDGMIFDIDISNETKKLLDQYIKQNGAGQSSGAGLIKAPMPGLIVKIMVEEGQKINKGDNVIIVEAMKMENSLHAPISGIVKSVKVHEGQAVDKDTLLIEIEADTIINENN